MADSSLKMQAKWDWANTSASNKYSTEVQVYRNTRPNPATASGFPIIVTKNKVRGKGRALQLRFTSEAGKDAELVGWGIWVNKSARP
jgi:hypothetical protein